MTGWVVAPLLACAVAAGGLQPSTAPRRGGNPDAAKIQNAVPATPESVAAGRRPYTQFCANCHGATGKGDGTAAGADQPSDLTDGVWDYGSSDGEMFTVIHDGIAGKDMGGYAGRLSDTDIWNVVNYVRSLNKAGK
jgi:mono/diheme cytochrome c family protein